MFAEKYKNTISIERLKSFSYGFELADEQFLITAYKLNIKASQCFYPVLSVVEIYLRNAIDCMLKEVIDEKWLEKELDSQNLLSDFDYKKLIEAYNNIKRRYGIDKVTRGKIIAELTFGFWVNLCSKKYNPKIWTKKGAFRGVFENYPKEKKEQIHELSQKLTKIKRLRNRVFHYEPILNKKNDILGVYNGINEILGYLPRNGSSILNDTCNFMEVMAEILPAFEKEFKRIKNKNLENYAMQEETQGCTNIL